MKVSRHAKIIELISQYDIETQEELAEYLNNAGFKVTQATVSRDIRDLKLSKVSTGSGHQKYILHRKRWVCGDGYGAEYSSDQDCFRYGNGCGCRCRRNEMA